MRLVLRRLVSEVIRKDGGRLADEGHSHPPVRLLVDAGAARDRSGEPVRLLRGRHDARCGDGTSLQGRGERDLLASRVRRLKNRREGAAHIQMADASSSPAVERRGQRVFIPLAKTARRLIHNVSWGCRETTVTVAALELFAALEKCIIPAGAPHTRAPLPDDADAIQTPTTAAATRLMPRPLINSFRAIIPLLRPCPAPCRADAPNDLTRPCPCQRLTVVTDGVVELADEKATTDVGLVGQDAGLDAGV